MSGPVVDTNSLLSNLTRYNLVSWSKNGFIAYSLNSNSKHNLFLTYLENVNGKQWQLAKPQSLTVKPTIDGLHAPELSLVSWSNLSTDLAIADIFGNFYILLAGVGLIHGEEPDKSSSIDVNNPRYELTSYNHLEMIYRDIINNHPNQKPNVNVQFVSFSWLPIEKNQIINKDAQLVTKSDSLLFTYNYGVDQYHPKNLCHPISTKQACIALRMNGELVLHYQGEHKVEYHKITTHLNEGFEYDMNIETASFGFPNDKRIILVTYDVLLKKIRTYMIKINWGFLVEAASKQRSDPHYNTPKELQKPPVMTCSLIHEMAANIENYFTSVHYDDDIELDDLDAMDVDKKQDIQQDYRPKHQIGKLTSIDIILPLFNENDSIDILVTYEYYDENFKISTSILRYSLTESESTVSDAFAQIGRKKGALSPGTGIEPEFTLIYQDKLYIPKRVLSVEGYKLDLIVVCEDGDIKLVQRNPAKMVEKSRNGEGFKLPESISSMVDAGFEMPKINISGSNPVMLAFSPNGIGAVYMELNDELKELKLQFMEKRGSSDISLEVMYVTSVAFAFQHAFACYCNISSDDILVMIQLEVARVSKLTSKYISEKSKQLGATDSFIESIICESHKAINFQLDIFSKESVDKLLSNPPLQKLLSLQLILGGLDYRVNDISTNVAWIILNLRSTSFGIMFLLSSIYRQISKKKPTEDTIEDSINRSESITSLTGNVRWLVELIICLNQEILQLYMTRKNPENSKINLSNSIALPIILSKVPRLFLMYALSSIGKTHEVLKKLNKDLLDSNKLFTPMKDALNRYFTACSNSPLNLNLYESFIRECDGYINNEMGNIAKTKPKGHILKLEQQLVCNGKVDGELLKIGQWVVSKFASFISRDLKTAEMFYYNVDWLDIGYKFFDNKYSSDAKDIDVGTTGADADKQHHEELFRYSGQMIPKHTYKNHVRIDALRKVFIDINDESLLLRKCTRCRSISLVNDPMVFSEETLGLWTMVFQRTCVCGSAWVNI